MNFIKNYLLNLVLLAVITGVFVGTVHLLSKLSMLLAIASGINYMYYFIGFILVIMTGYITLTKERLIKDKNE